MSAKKRQFRGYVATRNRGFSFLEILIVVGIMSIFAAGAASMSINQVKMMRSMELRSELMVLRSAIANNIDCPKTSRAVCTGKPTIYTRTNKMRLPGARQDGSVTMADILKSLSDSDIASQKKDADVVLNTGKHLEQWFVAAQCKKGTSRSWDVHLYYARKKGDLFTTDPTTGVPYAWRDLYRGPICQGYTGRVSAKLQDTKSTKTKKKRKKKNTGK